MAAFRDDAYGQLGSPFFTRLPPEIRHQIYEALIHSAGLTQHIYKSDVGESAPVSHARCLINPDDPDLREQKYFETFSEESGDALGQDQKVYDQRLWRGRQYTDWCNHWQCEEGDPAIPPDESDARTQHFSAFLGPLLTCKRMHDEFIDLVYSSLTFCFINTPAAHRFLATTPPRYLGLIRSVHLVWCASVEDPEDWSETLAPGNGSLDGHDAVQSLHTWKQLWSQWALRAPRLSRVRVWSYGRFPRFPMPPPEYFQVLDDFANGCLQTGMDGERSPRTMERFAVQIAWTREFDGHVVDGASLEDDGETVPDWLRGRRFEVSRVAAVEYEPDVWMAMWAVARPRLEETGGLGRGAVRKGKGWGIRGKLTQGQDGRVAFLRS